MEAVGGRDRVRRPRLGQGLPRDPPQRPRGSGHPGKLAAVDTGALPGDTTCYSVFALDHYKTHLAAAHSNPVLAVAPTTSTASSSSSMTTSLVKIVGAVALAVLLLAAMAFVIIKLIGRGRQDDWQYSQTSGRGGRVTMGRYEGGAALVIPAAIVVVGVVLLIAAALSL